MISQYNLPQSEKYGIKNMGNLFLKRLTIRGFICSDPSFLAVHAESFGKDMATWLLQGKIKTKIDVVVGMDNAAAGWIGMMNGRNFGKAVLKIADVE